jgi:hypothetical protein
MDRLEDLVRGVAHLVEGFREVLQEVQAIRDLEGCGGALPGPVRLGSGPLPGAHADAGMRL